MKKIFVVLMALVLCLLAFAACDNGKKPPEVTYDVNAAVTYVSNLYKNKGPETAADFDVTSKVQVGGIPYEVEWTATEGVTITKKDENTYTVDINEKATEAYEYTLTATVKAGDGTTAKKEFKFSVPKYEVLSFEQYMAAKEGDNVTIEGIVVAINSKAAGNSRNHLFLADANVVGGYYSYQMEKDPVADLGIEVGMTVTITGPVAPYSGMQEIKGGVAKIVDSNKKEYAPVDITDKVAAGESLKNYVGLPVTIKGVEIAGQELGGTSDYLKFKLGDTISYIRTYVTDFPTTLKAEDKAAIDAAHEAKYGWKANVTGILVLYNSAPYLIPMTTDCFEYLEKVEKTPEQKVQEELDLLTIPTFISKDTTLELPLKGTNYTDVTYTWAVDKEGYTIDAEGKIALTVSSTPVELKFTVTAKCGDKTATKDITVKVALAKMSIKEALELEDGAEVVIVGVVTGIADKDAWSEQYKNMSVTLTDASGSIYLFRIPAKVEIGDVISVTGKMATYKENRQIAQGATVEVLKVYTSAEATEAEDGTEVVLKGKVTEINTAWSDQYKNITVTITDGAGTFYLYRLSTNVQVGDEVVVFGKVGSYKGSKQLAQGGTAVITKAASEAPAVPEAPSFVEVPIDSDKWDQCALKENWQGKDKVQYRGFAAGSTHGAGGFMFRYGENSTVPATDISGMKYIEFDVYVSHIDMIAEAQFSFELSSSGTSDKEESCKKFYGKDTGWVVGWNHVKWNLSDFTEHGPDNKAMDATKWNFIRWYNDTTITIGEEKLKVAIVNIKFTNDDYVAEEKPAAPEMPAKPTGDALATFTFGDNGEAAHVDGQDLGETASYTSGDYKLDLTGMSKVYGPATDAKGNSCIKMGTSSKVGTFSFTVAEGVNKVVIRIASYKANVTKINVNGTVYDISANKSNDGSYFEIVVDTSTTKTVTIATVEGACRAMIDSIAYYA